MKIAVLIYSLAGGGAERVVSQLLNYLHQENIELHLVLMNDLILYDIPEQLIIHNLENSSPNELGLLKLIKIPILSIKYRSYLKDNNIDVSVSFLQRPNYINVLSNFFFKKCKIIISERSNPSEQYNGYSFHSILNKILISFLFPKADLIIANSEGNRRELINNFNLEGSKIITINNPINISQVDSTKEVCGFYDKEYFNFVSVGRLNIGKNHKLLIQAFAEIINKKTRLYIFGEGEMKLELQELIKDLKLNDRVILSGFKNEIFSYLKGGDAFLFGSNHEGFPNVLLEAMACELPIITTNCNSGPDEIMNNFSEIKSDLNIITKFGILVPIGNKDLMIEAINRIVEDKEYYRSCKINVKSRAYNFRTNVILEKYKNSFKNKNL